MSTVILKILLPWKILYHYTIQGYTPEKILLSSSFVSQTNQQPHLLPYSFSEEPTSLYGGWKELVTCFTSLSTAGAWSSNLILSKAPMKNSAGVFWESFPSLIRGNRREMLPLSCFCMQLNEDVVLGCLNQLLTIKGQAWGKRPWSRQQCGQIEKAALVTSLSYWPTLELTCFQALFL